MDLFQVNNLIKQEIILNSKITETFPGKIGNGLQVMSLISIILVMNVNLINLAKILKLDLDNILMTLKICK
jgi:hypothetical protein